MPRVTCSLVWLIYSLPLAHLSGFPSTRRPPSTPCSNAEDAVAFYLPVFKDAKIHATTQYPEIGANLPKHRSRRITDSLTIRIPLARGTRSALVTRMVAVIAKRSAAQIRTEVRTIKKAGNEINKSPKSARAFLQKHGFITKDNKVGKHYR